MNKNNLKNTIKTIFFLLSMPISAQDLPPELSDCDRMDFSYGDLGYYEKNELILGYCRCFTLSRGLKDSISLHSKRLELKAGIYGADSHQYNEVTKELNRAVTGSKISAANASKIKRVLKKDYKHLETLECAQQETTYEGDIKEIIISKMNSAELLNSFREFLQRNMQKTNMLENSGKVAISGNGYFLVIEDWTKEYSVYVENLNAQLLKYYTAISVTRNMSLGEIEKMVGDKAIKGAKRGIYIYKDGVMQQKK